MIPAAEWRSAVRPTCNHCKHDLGTGGFYWPCRVIAVKSNRMTHINRRIQTCFTWKLFLALYSVRLPPSMAT
jgi:hypothetical protein